MIAKLIKGRGFRGAVEYDLRKDKGYLLETNMAGADPRTLAREFGQVRALRPNLSKAVCHVSISLPPGEKLTDDAWKEVAQTYLKKMGFHDNQFVVSRHTDADHQHIHILANRITMGGEVVSDSKDYQRQEKIMRGLEKEFGLSKVQNSREVMRKAPSKGEIEHSLRTGEASVRQRLQMLVDKSLKDSPTLEAFTERLNSVGTEVVLNRASTGRISGISFKLDDVQLKGSDLGRGYTWKNLQKRGVQYEQAGYDEEKGRGKERRGNRQHVGVDRDSSGRETWADRKSGHASQSPGQGAKKLKKRISKEFSRDR